MNQKKKERPRRKLIFNNSNIDSCQRPDMSEKEYLEKKKNIISARSKIRHRAKARGDHIVGGKRLVV